MIEFVLKDSITNKYYTTYYWENDGLFIGELDIATVHYAEDEEMFKKKSLSTIDKRKEMLIRDSEIQSPTDEWNIKQKKFGKSRIKLKGNFGIEIERF